MKARMEVMGIDAGGSKTVCLLADRTGAIVAEARGPGANLQIAGELGIEKVLNDVIERVLSQAPDAWPATICIGMAGVDREPDATVVRAIMRRLCRGSRVLVVNDARIALAAGAGHEPGIVLIAGTGSIAYGRNGAGANARAGGWGYAIGDEGSGYWIGRHALAAVVRAFDGRAPDTQLTPAVLAHFDVTNPMDLVRIVYSLELPRMNVSGLGPVVERASAGGDAVATAILERAADELALAGRAVATGLGMRGDAFPFVLSGSMFRVVPSLLGLLAPRLEEAAPRASLQPLQKEPATGAVLLALEG
jgi:N-acetylglucosamine kinase